MKKIILVLAAGLSGSQAVAHDYPGRSKEKELPSCTEAKGQYPCRTGASYITPSDRPAEIKLEAAFKGVVLEARPQGGEMPLKFVGFTIHMPNNPAYGNVDGATDQHGRFELDGRLDDGTYVITLRSKHCKVAKKVFYNSRLGVDTRVICPTPPVEATSAP